MVAGAILVDHCPSASRESLDEHYSTWSFSCPLIGFLFMLFTPKEKPDVSRWTALAISIGIFVVSLGLLAPYWFAYPDRLHVPDL